MGKRGRLWMERDLLPLRLHSNEPRHAIRTMTTFHIDTFSGSLGELPKGQRTQENALRVLAADPRVSTFERGTAWLEHLLSELTGNGLIVEENEPYPWHRYSLTTAGRRMLEIGK